MEKEVYGYIYKITNTVNGKIYIGLTTNGFNRRYSTKGEGIEKVYNYHTSRKRREEFYNAHLLNSIEKYGFKAFEVIKEFDVAYSEEELKEKERYWISYYKCNDRNYGYNSTEGGDTGSGLSGKEHPNYKGTVTFKCAYCGKEVERRESYKKYVSNIFCSDRCQYDWRSERMKGENSPVYKGFVVVYPNGEVSKEMTAIEVSDYLNLSTPTITDLARKKTCYTGVYGRIRYVRVLYLEDYLKEREIYKSDEDFRNMCKCKIEESEILCENKKEEFKKTMSEVTRGIKNGNAKLLICIFPDGRIKKNCLKGLAEELEVDKGVIRRMLNSHESYKAPNGKVTKERLEHLKTLEGIIIMEEEDYLREREVYKSDEDFRNMCKRKIEESEIFYQNKKDETSRKMSEIGKRIKVNAKLIVCIFPDGRIIKDICTKELAEELGISTDTIRSILRSHEPYKPTYKRLKHLEGIIIMEQEDYLKKQNQQDN